MSPLGASPSDFVRVRELDLAIKFLSTQISDGFKATHELQRQTNGRLLKAEAEIRALQQANAVEDAVEESEAKTRAKMSTMALSVASALGGAVLGGVGAIVKRLLGW